jgi:hypothetical protein
MSQAAAEMKLVMITADPELAARAERAGVGRLMVDLERIGKFERQKCRDTWISKHEMADVAPVAAVLSHADLIVRINPLHTGSRDEIDNAIASGAQLIMLPMFTTLDEVAETVSAIGGRCGLVPLIETSAALAICGEVAKLDGVTEIFIGLNDLHLSLGLDFMFEPLASGLLDDACARAAASGKPYGFGGIARVGEGALLAELIMGEHARLGSTRVHLSRTFARAGTEPTLGGSGVLRREVARLLDVYEEARNASSSATAINRAATAAAIADIVRRVRAPQS